MNKTLTLRWDWLNEKAREIGVDHIPIKLEWVSQDVMLEVMSYGLPTRARHWTYGQSYEYQKLQGEMGLSKVYELILNNDPSYAFMLETNSDIENTMVMAHIIGHCFEGDTLVDTPKGPVEINKIKEGDLVTDLNGKYQKVLKKVNTKSVKRLVEIKTKGFQKRIRCTPEHLILIKRKDDDSIFWTEAQNIDVKTDMMVIPKNKDRINESRNNIKIPINISQSTKLSKKALAKNGGYKVALDFSFGRVIGLYISEGFSNSSSVFSFGLHKDEVEYQDFIKKYFNQFNLNTSIYLNKKHNGCTLSTGDSSFREYFEKNCKAKSYNKEIPEDFIKNGAPKEFWAGLIRGLFEGDGSLNNPNSIQYTTTSKKLAYQLVSILRDFGIVSGIHDRKRKNRRESYDVFLSGESARKILDICEIQYEKPSRKIVEEQEDENYLYIPVTSTRKIELLKEIPVWDIEVENGHSFLLSNGVLAHNSHFFKHNCLFKQTNRKMVYNAAERAARIEEYIERYGIDRVEEVMNAALAIEKNIDWHKGLYRKPYPAKRRVIKKKKNGEFADLFGQTQKTEVVEVVENKNFPPYPEYDLLWFAATYSSLENWQKDIFEIIREESFYFYPQYYTKIMNEGFACVGGGTIINTDAGMISASELMENSNAKEVFDGESRKEIIARSPMGKKDSVCIKTKRGYEIVCSKNHRILDQNNEWIYAKDIEKGHQLKISIGDNIWSKENQRISFEKNKIRKTLREIAKKAGVSKTTIVRRIAGQNIENKELVDKLLEEYYSKFNDEHTTKYYKNKQIDIEYPEFINEDIAYVIGLLVGDGNISKKGRVVCLTSGDSEIIENYSKIIKENFNLNVKISKNENRFRAKVYSKQFRNLLTNCFQLTIGKSAEIKNIPEIILKSKKEIVSKFLSGLFDADGCAHSNGITYTTKSEDMSKMVQSILANFGIISSRKRRKDHTYAINIFGFGCKIFKDNINFFLKRKAKKLEEFICNKKYFKNIRKYDEVVEVKDLGQIEVYDISVKNTRRYSAQGFIHHNCWTHAELMLLANEAGIISDPEYIDFLRVHERVVQPGGDPMNINPYFLGYTIFLDIQKRWDRYHAAGESELTGFQKILQVVEEDDDISFIRNYLTPQICKDLKMFTFINKYDPKVGHLIRVESKHVDDIIESIVSKIYNYRTPQLAITEASHDGIEMVHMSADVGTLDVDHLEKVMRFFYQIWGKIIDLETRDDEDNVINFTYDELGFSHAAEN